MPHTLQLSCQWNSAVYLTFTEVNVKELFAITKLSARSTSLKFFPSFWLSVSISLTIHVLLNQVLFYDQHSTYALF